MVLYRASGSAGDQTSGCYTPLLWIGDAGGEMLAECFQEAGSGVTVNILLINHGHATALPWLNATAEGVTAFP